MIENKVLGERIRAQRKELKLTQTQLAELTGYSDKTAISKIEGSHTDLNQTSFPCVPDLADTCVFRHFSAFSILDLLTFPYLGINLVSRLSESLRDLE